MKSSIWRRVDIQVSSFTAIVVAPLALSIFWSQYRITCNDILVSLRDRAEATYEHMEKRPDKNAPDQIRIREDMEGDIYKQAHEAFQRIREISGVRYFYTAKMDEGGEFACPISRLGQSEPDFRCSGDLIEREVYPDMQRALDGQKVLLGRIKDTEWGEILITYMPIYDREQVLEVVRIEFEVGYQYNTYRNLRLLLLLFILLFSPGACLASRLLFRRISNPFYQDMLNADCLTQLKNRNTYQLDIGNHIVRKTQEGIGLILLDLNGLKRVSDILGHDAGDVYITYASKAYLNMWTREAMMYRIGGDEFVVVMPNTNRDKIQGFVRWFGDMFNRETSVPRFTFSQGYSIYDPKAGADLYSTYRRANKNTYMRKQQYYKNKSTWEGTDGIVGQAV